MYRGKPRTRLRVRMPLISFGVKEIPAIPTGINLTEIT